MNNQQGNITSAGILFTFLIISFGSILIKKKISQISFHNQMMKNFLCTKEANGLLKKHKEFITKTNYIIHLANLGKAVGLISNPGVTVSSDRAKQATQLVQNTYHISFLKNIGRLYSEKCKFTPTVVNTLYRTKGVAFLERNSLGTVKRRDKKWSYSTLGLKNTVRTTFSNGSTSTQNFQIKKALDLLKF